MIEIRQKNQILDSDTRLRYKTQIIVSKTRLR
jgi:hypothetical protein